MRLWPTVVALLLASLTLATPTYDLPLDLGAGSARSASDWRAELVARPGTIFHPRIEVDSEDRPHVLACLNTNAADGVHRETWYAVRDERWSLELVVPTYGSSDCGSFALGAADEPHMYELRADDAVPRVYGVRLDGTWRLSPTTQPGQWETEFETDRTGALHAAWFRMTSGAPLTASVEFAILEGFEPTTVWTVETADAFAADESMALWVDLVFDAANRPHLLYYAHDGTVRHAVRDGTWRAEVVETIGPIYRSSFGISPLWGSLAVGPDDVLHVAYLSVLDGLRYGRRDPAGWHLETMSGPPTAPEFPHVMIGPDGFPRVGYGLWGIRAPDRSLMLATYDGLEWTTERIWDAEEHAVLGPSAPAFALDRCGNPHVVVYDLNDPRASLWYLTRGEPCDGATMPEREVGSDVDPDTLNLKSRGRWVTAYVTARNGSATDLDPASFRLNGVEVAWWDARPNETVMAKFERAALQATVAVGDRVEVALTGVWTDGEAFRAADYIRVIDSGNGPRR